MCRGPRCKGVRLRSSLGGHEREMAARTWDHQTLTQGQRFVPGTRDYPADLVSAYFTLRPVAFRPRQCYFVEPAALQSAIACSWLRQAHTDAPWIQGKTVQLSLQTRVNSMPVHRAPVRSMCPPRCAERRAQRPDNFPLRHQMPPAMPVFLRVVPD